MAANSIHRPPPQPILLQDRTLPTTTIHATPCPTHHLLALVLDKTSVALFRPTWHRLATITPSPPHQITALAWSPTASHIAIATAAPSLAIYSVDNVAFAPTKPKRIARDSPPPLYSLSTLPSPPSTILWAIPPPTPDLFPDRATALQPADHPPSAPLLLVGDASGTLSIYTHSLQFLAARIPVLPPSTSITSLTLSPDLRHLLVTGPQSHPASTLLRPVSLAHLSTFFPQISLLGRNSVAQTAFLATLRAATSSITQHWLSGAAILPSKTIFQPLDRLLHQFGEHHIRTAHVALHDVFCGARVTGPVLQFLATDLSENGAKEALRAYRAHIDSLTACLHAVLPAAENYMFRAAELRALARMEAQFAPVGLSELQADRLVDCAETVCARLAQFCWAVENVADETEAFLAWTVVAAARAGGELVNGRVGGLGNVEGEDARLVSTYFQNERTEEQCVTKLFNEHILPAVEELAKVCQEMAEKPCADISAQLVVHNGIAVPLAGAVPATGRRCSAGMMKDKAESPVVQARLVTGDGMLLTVKHDFADESWALATCGLLDEGLFLYDVAAIDDVTVVFIAGEPPMGDIGDGEEKVSGELAVHHVVLEENCWDVVHVDAGESTRLVSLPEPVQLGGYEDRATEGGELKWEKSVSLSLDEDRKVASVLHSLKRVLLFQLRST